MSGQKRYIVTKAIGSQYAYVKDALTGFTVKRYDIFKRDGWNNADKHAERLNAGIEQLKKP